MTTEELKAGRKYFIIAQHVILGLVLYATLAALQPYLVVSVLSGLVLFLFLCFFPLLRKYYLQASLLGLLLFLSTLFEQAVLTIVVLIFLWGLPSRIW